MNKFLRTITAFLLIAALLCGNAFSADSDEKSYESEVLMLKALGIVDSNFDMNAKMSRAEMALSICKMLGIYNGDNEEAITPFSDVPPEHKYSGVISMAYKAGLINGGQGAQFRPDDQIIYCEAVKMLVSSVGYDVQAMAAGGYPFGYETVARQRRISQNAFHGIYDMLTKGEAAKLMANTLEVDILQMDSVGVDGNSLKSVKGQTLLTERLGVYVVKDVVTGNEAIDLKTSTSVFDDKIKLGEELYNRGTTDLGRYLGYYVKAYIKEDKDGAYDTIIHYEIDSRNEVLVINADDIVRSETTFDKIVWEKTKDRRLTAYISKYASIVKNGVLQPSISSADLCPDSGEIVLVARDGGKEYDFVDIRAYETYVVDAVSKSLGRIYGKYTSRPLDVKEEANRVVSITKDGLPSSIDEISEWNVLDVMTNVDNLGRTHINITITTKFTMGIVDGVDLTENIVTISGREYDVAHSYIVWTQKNGIAATALESGALGNFYFDSRGKIAAFNNNSEALWQYGVVLGAAKAREAGTVGKLQIFTQNGTVMEVSFEKVRLNNSRTDGDAVASRLNLGELISFRLDADMNVTDILHDVNSAPLSWRNAAEGQLTCNIQFGGGQWRDGMGAFLGTYGLSETSAIFVIPSIQPGDTVIDSEDCRIMRYAELANDKEYARGTDQYIRMYDAKNDRIAKAAVMVESSRAIPDFVTDWTVVPLMIVTKTAISVNSSGNNVQKITGYFEFNDKPVSYMMAKQDTLDYEIKPGDIIQRILNSKGEIEYVRLWFRPGSRPTDPTDPFFIAMQKDPVNINPHFSRERYGQHSMSSDRGVQDYNADAYSYYGIAVARNGTRFTLTTNNDRETINLLKIGGSSTNRVYRVDMTNLPEVRVEKGTSADIIPTNEGLYGSKLLIHTRTTRCIDVIVLELADGDYPN